MSTQEAVRQTQNTQLRWDALTTEQRIAIVNVAMPKAKARLRHKLIYGTWEQLGATTQDRLYRFDWFKILGLEVA